MSSPRCSVVTLWAAFACSAALAVEPPLPVSPGSVGRIERIAAPCPTFSWAGQPGALAVRVAVYAIPADESAPPTLVADKQLPAAASSWTPALPECLAPGTYAWGVGVVTDEGGPFWSAAAWFQVVAAGTALPGIPGVAGESHSDGAATAGGGAAIPEVGALRGRLEPRTPTPERLLATQFSVGSTGNVAANAVTATSFTGDGSGLTNLNATQLTSGTVPGGRLSGTYTINVNGTALNVTGLTQGGVTFGDATGKLSQDANNFFWDDTSNRLGLGTSAPFEQLQLTGNLRLPQTTAAPVGVLFLGPARFLHGYHPSPGGVENTFVGYNAGNFAMGAGGGSNGTNNTGLGYAALSNVSSGWNNTGVGSSALRDATTGSYNTGVGSNSLGRITVAFSNTAVGALSLANNVNSHYNTAVGVNALSTLSFTNGGVSWEGHNTAVGYAALAANQPTSPDEGVNNTAVGSQAMASNTTGGYNAATGHQALWQNLTGNENTANGDLSMRDNTSGNNNTAVGAGSLMTNQTGSNNTAIGWMALGNVAVGQSGNVALGFQAGLNEAGSAKLHIANTSATDLIWGDFTAQQVVVGATGPVPAAALGPGLYVTGTLGAAVLPAAAGAPLCDGGGGVAGVIGICGGPSDARLKTSVVPLADELDILATLSRLRGVAFNWDRTNELMRHASDRREIGMIAQEVEAVLPSLVSQHQGGYRSLDYAKLTAFLVEVAKAQQAEIEELKRMVEALAAQR